MKSVGKIVNKKLSIKFMQDFRSIFLSYYKRFRKSEKIVCLMRIKLEKISQ